MLSNRTGRITGSNSKKLCYFVFCHVLPLGGHTIKKCGTAEPHLFCSFNLWWTVENVHYELVGLAHHISLVTLSWALSLVSLGSLFISLSSRVPFLYGSCIRINTTSQRWVKICQISLQFGPFSCRYWLYCLELFGGLDDSALSVTRNKQGMFVCRFASAVVLITLARTARPRWSHRCPVRLRFGLFPGLSILSSSAFWR